MADRFDDLRTFVAVVSAGGITAGAAELGIAKSAVSRRISEMEERLGVTLISRSTRSFEPTLVGQEYYRRSLDILASLRNLDSNLATGSRRQRVTIVAHASVITHVLLPLLARERSALTDIVIAFVADDAGPHGDLSDIRVGGMAPEGWDNRIIATTRTITCASSAYLDDRGTPRTRSDFETHERIVVDAGAIAGWVSADERFEAAATAVLTPDIDTAAAAAIAGLGLVRLPDFAVAKAVADGRLTMLAADEETAATPLRVFYRADPPIAVLRLVDALARREARVSGEG